MRTKNKDSYTVVVLGDKTLSGDIGDCLITSCTNKFILSEITGISLNRLVYIFTKQKKNVLIENGVLILRSRMMYMGRQSGGLRNPMLISFNRNK